MHDSLAKSIFSQSQHCTLYMNDDNTVNGASQTVKTGDARAPKEFAAQGSIPNPAER